MITILYTDTTEVRGAMLLPEEALPDSVFSAAAPVAQTDAAELILVVM